MESVRATLAPRQVHKAATQWENHVAYDCEYCPGLHHVKAEALTSEDKLTAFATEHWTKLLADRYGQK